jgi:HD-GYP domain-containing protein (c-di-GMP phosphodiesterase class II)
MNLIDRNAVLRAVRELPISPANGTLLLGYLDKLQQHDEETYEHSMRVGISLYRISRDSFLDSQLMFLAGVCHDIGKIEIDNAVLRRKGKDFRPEDFEIIKEHPKSGYELLLPINRLISGVVFKTHIHQEHGYPLAAKELDSVSEEDARLIEIVSLYTAIVDCYDACTHRENSEKGRVLTTDECFRYVSEKYPRHTELVRKISNSFMF